MKQKVVNMKKKGMISQEIISLEKKHSRLTPALVVKAARNPKSPLHSAFEWDDSKAGEMYRLEQARSLIANVRAKITTTEHKYGYVSYIRDARVPAKEQGYVSVEKLRTDKKWARECFELEIKQVLARFERLREIAEPLGLQSRVDRMIADLQAFERSVAA